MIHYSIDIRHICDGTDYFYRATIFCNGIEGNVAEADSLQEALELIVQDWKNLDQQED